MGGQGRFYDPRLRDASDMARFKRLASGQMYVAVVFLPLAWVPLIAWAFGIAVAGATNWLDLLLYVVLPLAAVVATSGAMVGLARAVRATPTDGPALAAERDRVADVWVSRRFPDW